MKFDFDNKPDFETQDEVDLVGNVYLCKGGNKTRFWVIVGVRANTVICLGVDEEGNITSSSNYGLHVFHNSPWARKRVGRVIDMPEMKFNVAWESFR